MAITMKHVRARLDPDEPDYPAAAAALGAEALPFLAKLVQGRDPMLASKAAYLASLLSGVKAVRVLELASAQADPVIRVAAAAGLRNLDAKRPSKAAAAFAERILADEDAGVRRVAAKSPLGKATKAALKKKTAQAKKKTAQAKKKTARHKKKAGRRKSLEKPAKKK